MSKTKEKITQKTILVVDDDEDFRLGLQGWLESEGYLVESAEGQRKADQLLAEGTKPDLAIVNLVMEEMDSGFVLSYHLKKMNPKMPVIMVTASTADTHLDFHTASEEERLWIKADVVLEKPLRFEQLERELSRLL